MAAGLINIVDGNRAEIGLIRDRAARRELRAVEPDLVVAFRMRILERLQLRLLGRIVDRIQGLADLSRISPAEERNGPRGREESR